MKLAITLLVLLLSISGQGREVQFNWNPMTNATGYEIQISETQKFDNILDTGKSEKPEHTANLKMGQYFYRVRAIDLKGRAGRWSSPATVTIAPYGPDLIEPATGIEVTYIELLPKIRFTWKAPPEAEGEATFEILISKGNGQKVLEKQVDKPELEINDLAEGNYIWQVRAIAKKIFISNYSESRTLIVKRSPLVPPELLLPAKDGGAPAYRPVYYLWKPDPRAKYADLIIERLSDTKKKKPFKKKIDNLTTPDHESEFEEPGKYRWTVITKEEKNTPGVTTEPFEFEVRNDYISRGNFELEFSLSPVADLYTTNSARQTLGNQTISQQSASQGTFMGFLGGYYVFENLGFFLSTRTARVSVENSTQFIQETDANMRIRMGATGFNQEFILGYRMMDLIAAENSPTQQTNNFTTSGPLIGTRLTATIIPKLRAQIAAFYYKPVNSIESQNNLTADVYGGHLGFKWNFMYQFWLGYRFSMERINGTFKSPGQSESVNATWTQYRTEPFFFSISFEH